PDRPPGQRPTAPPGESAPRQEENTHTPSPAPRQRLQQPPRRSGRTSRRRQRQTTQKARSTAGWATRPPLSPTNTLHRTGPTPTAKCDPCRDTKRLAPAIQRKRPASL